MGYCPKHYKQFLRHGRLTPEREHRSTCRIVGCNNKHKGRGYCAKHYKELIARGCIENNGHIKDPFCAVSDCKKKPKRRGLCEEHFNYYLNLYIENGYSWAQVDKIIVLYNQRLLFNRNRISLIRERHKMMFKTKDKEIHISRIPTDIIEDMDDEGIDEEDISLINEDFGDGLLDDLWSEAESYESCDIWEEGLQNMC
jgi:hypothetical protein